MACVSNANRSDLPRVNEIVCFRLDGSLNALVVAPNMTDLNASGGGSDDYAKLPKGNLDVTGEYFIWTANARHRPARRLSSSGFRSRSLASALAFAEPGARSNASAGSRAVADSRTGPHAGSATRARSAAGSRDRTGACGG